MARFGYWPRVAAAILASSGTLLLAAEPQPGEVVRQRVAELDHDRFQVRQQAEADLLELGEAALPALQEAQNHDSREVRFRAMRVATLIRHRILRGEFLALAEAGENMDFERALCRVAQLVSPAARPETISEELDKLAAAVRRKLGQNFDPARTDPRQAMTALREVLFVELGFDGNRADYANPENSALDRVLATKRGLPILLSQVVVAVARRLKLPVVGVPASVQYLVKYDGSRAPAGFAKGDIYMNPFEQGALLEPAEVAERVDAAEAHLLALRSKKSATLRRVLSNMVSHLRAVGRAEEAALADEFRQLFVDETEEDDPFQ